jgi:hypothetical protein
LALETFRMASEIYHEIPELSRVNDPSRLFRNQFEDLQCQIGLGAAQCFKMQTELLISSHRLAEICPGDLLEALRVWSSMSLAFLGISFSARAQGHCVRAHLYHQLAAYYKQEDGNEQNVNQYSWLAAKEWYCAADLLIGEEETMARGYLAAAEAQCDGSVGDAAVGMMTIRTRRGVLWKGSRALGWKEDHIRNLHVYQTRP